MTLDAIRDVIEKIQVNTEATKNISDNILKENTSITSEKKSIFYIANTDLPNVFSGESPDIESMITELKENANFLDELIRFNDEFATTLYDYSTSLERTSQE